MKTALNVAKINLKQAKLSYLITGLAFLLALASYITSVTVPGSENNTTTALGDYLYLLPLLMAVLIPALQFRKLMNLGSKRLDFLKGSIFAYIPAVAGAVLVSIALHLNIDPVILTRIEGVDSLLDVFGFMARGPVVAFLQMCAFLLLFCCVLHTLTLIQGRWYGWVTDVLIVAIISVFTPIAPLRAALVWFFNMIIFHESAVVQIFSCLILGAVIYCASIIPIRSRQI